MTLRHVEKKRDFSMKRSSLCEKAALRFGNNNQITFLVCLSLLAVTLMADAQDGLSNISIHYDRDQTSQVAIAWSTIPGKSYFLLSSPEPGSGWAALNPQPILAATNMLIYRDSNVPSARFYQVVELGSTVQPELLGTNAQYWQASDAWVPTNNSVMLSGSNTLLALGAWWTEGYTVSPMPADTNGLFVSAINARLGLYPVQVQLAYEAGVVPGDHSVTPPPVGGSGDGFFLLVQAQGLGSSPLMRDSGYSLTWHTYYGFNDPNKIQSVKVTTDGSAAQIGDLAVAIFVMDNDSNPNINISLPEGWTSLGFNNNATDNIGYRACYKIVSSTGEQSVTCTWTDDSTYVAAGAIAVFGSAGNP